MKRDTQTRPLQTRSANRLPCISFLARISLMRAFAALSLPLAATVAVHAQTAGSGSIHGRINNAGSNTFLNNARVRIVGTTRETFTNESGEFRFDNVPAGNV